MPIRIEFFIIVQSELVNNSQLVLSFFSNLEFSVTRERYSSLFDLGMNVPDDSFEANIVTGIITCSLQIITRAPRFHDNANN